MNATDDPGSVWQKVAKGNDRAVMRAINGDLRRALRDLDAVRDQCLALDDDPNTRNEIECRRMESRMAVATVARSWDLFEEVLGEIGNSNRFSAERLHLMVTVAAGVVRDLRKGHTP